MSKSYIPKKLRTFVEERAKGYCEYCLAPSNFSPSDFELDHIIPEVLVGETSKENLALACRRCNGLKFTKISHLDIETNRTVRLYHPRTDKWEEHFQWNQDETILLGKTSIGTATIDLLQINRESNINQRNLLRMFGWHPPKGFPE